LVHVIGEPTIARELRSSYALDHATAIPLACGSVGKLTAPTVKVADPEAV